MYLCYKMSLLQSNGSPSLIATCLSLSFFYLTALSVAEKFGINKTCSASRLLLPLSPLPLVLRELFGKLSARRRLLWSSFVVIGLCICFPVPHLLLSRTISVINRFFCFTSVFYKTHRPGRSERHPSGIVRTRVEILQEHSSVSGIKFQTMKKMPS